MFNLRNFFVITLMPQIKKIDNEGEDLEVLIELRKLRKLRKRRGGWIC